MIDIYCTDGQLLGVMYDYDVMMQILRDDFIKSDTFIEFQFEDGDRGAVKKNSIICIVDCNGTQEV